MSSHSDAYKAFYVKLLRAEKKKKLRRFETAFFSLCWVGCIAVAVAWFKYVYVPGSLT